VEGTADAMTGREAILGRLRAAQERVQLPPAEASPLSVAAVASIEECIARFSVEAASLGVECHVETSLANLRERVRDMTAHQAVLSWDAAHLPYNLGQVLTTPQFGAAPRETLASARIGFTGCDAAIAETASLVLFSGRGRSRAVSLLPPIHVAIVERQKLCFTMAEMFARYGSQLRDAASCTVITGPSRTADIELTLTLGIHGPGRVIVLIGP
jgi:L-lactate dehydrogenase complex protein LldG